MNPVDRGSLRDLDVASLPAGEALLDLLNLLSPVGAWAWDVRVDRAFFGAAWAQTLGVGREALEGTSCTWKERLHPEDRERVLHSLEKCLSGSARHFHSEHRLLHSGGDWIWVQEVGRVTSRDPAGRPERMVRLHMDVTAWKLGEEETYSHMVFLEELLEAVPIPVFYKDRSGRYLGCNEAFAAFAGLRREEIVGRQARDIAPPEMADEYEEAERRVWAEGGRQVHQETRVQPVGGPPRDALCYRAPFTAGRGSVEGVVGVILDITDRKRTEQELTRLAAAVEQAHEAVVISDRDGTIVYVNPSFERVTGYSRTEAIGRHPGILSSGTHSPEFYAELWKTILGGNVWRGRFVNRRKNGDLFHEEATISPIRDEAGEIVQFVAVKRDISQELILESQLRQAQKLEAVGQLAAGIAHEINTPIQFVEHNLRFLQDAFRELISKVGPDEADESSAQDLEFLLEEVPRAVEECLDGVARVSKIVLAMKDFAHPGTGQKSPADLNRAVESVVAVSRNEWKYVADLVTDLDPELAPVEVMADEIKQVVLNLIVNATHAVQDAAAGRPGKKGKIRVSTRAAGDWAELCVEDDGTGIPGRIRGRVFDPFFTTKDVGRGTGQGLAIARSVVVDHHGGTIDFDSEEGVGTTFRVRLPVKALPQVA